jgi:uncharacterized lipoprotein YddW (UPF0748 family)
MRHTLSFLNRGAFPFSVSFLRPAVVLLAAAALVLAGCDSGGSAADNDDTGPPVSAQVAFVEDASFVVDSTVTVTATVKDAQERPVDQVVVRFRTGDRSGTVAPDTVTTGAEGTATTEWTLGASAAGPDAQALTVSFGGERVTNTTTVDVNPGPIASITMTAAQDTIAVDSTTTLSIAELRDANGNRIPNPAQYSFTWQSLTPDTATVQAGTPSSQAQVTGAADGTAKIMVSSGAAPNASLSAVKAASGAAADTVDVEVLQHELRGVWLTNTSGVLISRTRIANAMDLLDKYNFNVVFPVVWNNANTLYPSTVMDTLTGQKISPPYQGRDPLQEIIEEAHKRDIAVIPWFEYGFASSFSSGGGPILDEKPSWAARDQNGDLLKKNGFEWMNPYRPEVRDFMSRLMMEVVRNYDVDGIQGDDRLPGNPVEGGYSDYTKQLYRQEHNGQNPPTNERDPEWMEWRANILNEFGQRIYDQVKAHDEDLVVSWAPSIWDFGYREYLQDWPTWINQGSTDLIHPQVYRRDVGSYEATLASQAPDRAGWDASKVIGFYPGILLKVGSYTATASDIKAFVQDNRERGYKGEVFFYYPGIRENNEEIGKALKNSYYGDPAPLPFPRASAD